jgi:hypothetical protein
LNSSLNASVISEFSTDTVIVQKKVINLQKRFANAENLQTILNSYNDDTIIIFVDGKNQLWEIIKRDDMNINILKTPQKVNSIFKQKNLNESRLLNVEIKDIQNTSLNHSYLHTGKNEFNLSALLKD